MTVPLDAATSRLPFVTADLPGIGGTLKAEPSDFEVEEIPAYEPCGQGEHLFLWIEKRATPAYGLTRHIAQVLGISQSDIGTAGLKDTQAVTRQLVSVPARCEALVAALDTDRIRVLRATRHGNKLKTGHLRGNRFSVLVRDPVADALSRAQVIAERLEQTGLPNFYGEQRFGGKGDTLRMGLSLLTDAAAEGAQGGAGGRGKRKGGPRKALLRLALSSVQSALFNRVLACRMAAGDLDCAIAGDVMQVRASGGLFVVEDVQAEQARFDARETVHTGPMFGPKMRAPSGRAEEREREVLQEAGLSHDHFARFGKLLSGTRRPSLVWLDGLSVESAASGVKLQFVLPAGSYATVAMAEFMKNGATADEGEG